MIKKNDLVELEFGEKRKKLFLKIDLNTEEIWVDINYFPFTCFLCAMCDGISYLSSKCGSKGQYDRVLLPIEWLINDWGGPKEIVQALKIRKDKTLSEIPRLREKYL